MKRRNMYEYKNPYVIDFTGVSNYFAFHETIQKALDLPDYYGANMDALWDCLTDMVFRPIHIQVKGLETLGKDAEEEVQIMLKIFHRFKHYATISTSIKIKSRFFMRTG